MSAAPREAVEKRRQDFEDAMTALEIPEDHRLALRAAASAWAKASSVYATACFVDTRRADPEALGPN